MLIFNEKQCVNVCLKNKNEYVRLAVLDMIEDIKRISKYHISPEIVSTESENCIIIEENTSVGAEPIEDESFTVMCDGEKVTISAGGYLGTMWGIYTFCEKALGVNPCYLFNDLETEKRESLEIEPFCIDDKPKSFGFRGVFINDEDLLSGWMTGGGIRLFDYPWYGITVDTKAMEMVVETVLRLKFNLIIPASFIDIDNPPERALVDVAAKRGIYVSQHHVEPLGVSHYTFEVYCRKRGVSAECSYIKNPQILEEAWQYYAEKWAEYDNVVWQVGLRGRGDRPVWQEATPTTEELHEYGRLIGNAIARQKEIVLKVTGGRAKYFSSTLWMEGARLMNEKALDIPDNTVIVFSDAGINQLYCEDFYNVPRLENVKYGLYYHLQFYGHGPHLAPLTGLDKLYYNIDLADKAGDNDYCIVNASNIREFTFELGALSQMLWSLKDFSKQRYLDDYCKEFGTLADKTKGLITDYFDALATLDESLFFERDKRFFTYAFGKTPAEIKAFTLKDGDVLLHGSKVILNFKKDLSGTFCDEYYEAIKPGIPKYQEVLDGFKEIAAASDERTKRHVEVKWQCYAHTMLAIYTWYTKLYEARLSYFENNSEQVKALLDDACQSLEEYLKYRKCAEYGVFDNWYRGDTKMNVWQRLYDTRRLLGQTPNI